jgi:BirA family transcriptional regulator, biotin operon repressor / biotin---[acetyl-CoA-carboxylase] ligase
MSPLGLPRAHHRVLDSTNKRAKELAREGAPHGTVVTADEQTAGRGRQGRAWVAPAGAALLMSLVVRHQGELQALLPLTAAVAICEAVEGLNVEPCSIKWPNDIWVNRRKLAGILIEARRHEGVAVIGVGLNVSTTREEFPEELRQSATSLAIERAAGEVSRDAVLAALLGALEHWLVAEPDAVLAKWRARDALHGNTVEWAGGEGVAAGIDETGALLVDTPTGQVALDAGEVHLGRS